MKSPLVKILLVAGIIIAAVVMYMVFFKKKDPLEKAAVDADEQMYYDKMYNLLAANIDKSAIDHWLGDIIKNAYQTGDIAPDYLVNGRVTKPGALLASYARAYFGYGYKNKMDEKELNNQLYGIFYEYKGKHNKL